MSTGHESRIECQLLSNGHPLPPWHFLSHNCHFWSHLRPTLPVNWQSTARIATSEICVARFLNPPFLSWTAPGRPIYHFIGPWLGVRPLVKMSGFYHTSYKRTLPKYWGSYLVKLCSPHVCFTCSSTVATISQHSELFVRLLHPFGEKHGSWLTSPLKICCWLQILVFM